MKYLSIIFVILLLTNFTLNNRWHCEGSNYVSTELHKNCSWNSKSEEYDFRHQEMTKLLLSQS